MSEASFHWSDAIRQWLSTCCGIFVPEAQEAGVDQPLIGGRRTSLVDRQPALPEVMEQPPRLEPGDAQVGTIHPPGSASNPLDSTPPKPPRRVTSGRPRENHNGRVECDDDEYVLCRHFAWSYFSHPNKADFLGRMGNPSDIFDFFAGCLDEVEEDADSYRASVPEQGKHVVGLDQFGAFLAAIATSRHQSAAKSADMLVVTSVHAMAISIPAATTEDAPISIRIYDPNVTSDDDELIFDNLDHLRASGFLCLFEKADQYLAPAENCVWAICGDAPLDAPSGLDYLGEARRPDASDRFVLTHALQSGLPAVIDELGRRWSAPGAVVPPEDTLLGLDDDGHPGLLFAAEQGEVATLEAWGRAIRDLNLDRDTTLRLLSCRHKNGQSAFFAAMVNGERACVRALGQMFATLGLGRDEVLQILRERGQDEMNASTIAVQSGHGGCAAEFAEIMETYNITYAEL